MIIVQACAFSEDDDGNYRESMPSKYLSRLEGVAVIDCHLHHRYFYKLAELADVLIFFYPRS